MEVIMENKTNIDYTLIGSRIKQARQNKDMTQSKLAELLSVSPEYLSKVERANTKPSLPTLNEIASILDTTLTYLLEGTTKNSDNYKLEEFSQLIKDLSPAKRKLLYELGTVILKSDI
jgi:transcriptional regulator with XRE-family HTH domain